MRISELAERSGVPKDTVKYYLRERLIPHGESTSPTQAIYGEEHLAALQMVRSLLAAGLSIAQVRTIVAWLQEPVAGVDEMLVLLRRIHGFITERPEHEPVRDETRELVERYGWFAEAHEPAAAELQSAIDAAARAGVRFAPELMDAYGQAVNDLASAEVEGLPPGTPAETVRFTVLGTILTDRVLAAMRRVAQASITARRIGGEEHVRRMRTRDEAQASDTSSA